MLNFRLLFIPAAFAIIGSIGASNKHNVQSEQRSLQESQNNVTRNNVLSTDLCQSYKIDFPNTTDTFIHWTNGGGADSEWINVDNWEYGYLPGVYRKNQIIMAEDDVATVHCNATYMKASVKLELTEQATLDVQANLNIGKRLALRKMAKVTQSKQSFVLVGKKLYLDAIYEITERAKLQVKRGMRLADNGRLVINGDKTIVSIQDDTTINGWLTYNFGQTGTGTFDIQGELTIEEKVQF